MMQKEIKITKNLKIDLQDLMRTVDVSCEFTLADIISVCKKSRIPIDILGKILRCPCVTDFIKEGCSRKSIRKKGIAKDIEYLEIYRWIIKHTFEGIRTDNSSWQLHGIGYKGKIPDDVKKYCKLSSKEKRNYRQNYAVEFTPVNELVKLPIKIKKGICITDYDVDPKKNESLNKEIDFQESITLIELLYAIFYELSFFGNPNQRDEELKILDKRVKDIEDGKEKLIPWEQVKKKLNDKFKKNKRK